MVSAASRPVLRWHGGKWLLAPWIIGFMPTHRVYVEPFGGAASVLLRKPRAYAEIYNDLDGDVVNLFRQLRNPVAAQDLVRSLTLTPFARQEFQAAYEAAATPLEKARRLVIRSFMGFGSDGATGAYRTGFRANSNRSGTTPAQDWANYPAALAATIERLRGVVIENRDAAKVMATHDGPDTLHYVDPPYVHATRMRRARTTGGGCYRHEMTDEDHRALLAGVNHLTGMVILSGYDHPLYAEMLKGWTRHERDALADGARPRTEVIWLNQRLTERLHERRPSEGDLFDKLSAA